MATDELTKLIVSRKEAQAKGLKRYFTGLPCPQGHISERHIGNKACVRCNRVSKLDWQKRNPEKHYQINKRCWQNDPDKKYNIWSMGYYERNKEKIAARNHEHRKLTKERRKETQKAWNSANPERVKEHNANKRAKRKNCEGFYRAEDIARIRKLQRDKCAMPHCRVKLRGKGQVDHIMPISKGGSNWPKNLQLLCVSCNQSKRATDPIDFMRSHGALL